MAEFFCEVVDKKRTVEPGEPSSRAARRRRMEVRRYKFIAAVAALTPEGGKKRQKVGVRQSSREWDNGDESCTIRTALDRADQSESSTGDSEMSKSSTSEDSYDSLTDSADTDSRGSSTPNQLAEPVISDRFPKFGMTSVIGRRRDMEDAVAIHPSFFIRDNGDAERLHYFGIYDGHGCSHVAVSCKNRMHQLVKEELEKYGEESSEWKHAMERSFYRMDEEVTGSSNSSYSSKCRCELQTPDSDAVGSTAVVSIVTPNKIIVANCGDSRAVLCRGGKPVPLSDDHKPDRPDELQRIQDAGGRVIFWDGPRVLGVLAMSRAIGDNYLKPYVSSEPEVTITDRTENDECLIMASDGLWDVVSNETACGIARMCLRGQGPVIPPPLLPGSQTKCVTPGESSDQACSDAALLLTKLALARNSTDNVSVLIVDLRREHKNSTRT